MRRFLLQFMVPFAIAAAHPPDSRRLFSAETCRWNRDIYHRLYFSRPEGSQLELFVGRLRFLPNIVATRLRAWLPWCYIQSKTHLGLFERAIEPKKKEQRGHISKRPKAIQRQGKKKIGHRKYLSCCSPSSSGRKQGQALTARVHSESPPTHTQPPWTRLT